MFTFLLLLIFTLFPLTLVLLPVDTLFRVAEDWLPPLIDLLDVPAEGFEGAAWLVPVDGRLWLVEGRLWDVEGAGRLMLLPPDGRLPPPPPPPCDILWASSVNGNIRVASPIKRPESIYFKLHFAFISFLLMGELIDYFGIRVILFAFGGAMNSKTAAGITGLSFQLLKVASYCLFPWFL